MLHSKSLLRGLLVLTVLVLAYVLVAVAPASATTTLDIGVVRGTDNGVYWNSYSGSWGSWASLSGSTLSAPGICEAAGVGTVAVVVRGTDNGIYLNTWNTATWSGWSSPPGGGTTIDQPACAYLSGVLYVVVRGTGGELYWNSNNGVWSGWQDLHGQSASAPVLVSTPGLSRLDLVVQGTDNGIYHKAFTSGAWSGSWDSPGGATISEPAAALGTYFTGCSIGEPCELADYLYVVVRGTDNNVYLNGVSIFGSGPLGWFGWGSLSGQTLSAPTLAYYENGCPPNPSTGASACNSVAELAVRGTDNAVYHKPCCGPYSWDSPGGSIANSPALAYVPGSSAEFLLLVEGNPSETLYSNTVTGSTWTGYVSVGGATSSTPALVALV